MVDLFVSNTVLLWLIENPRFDACGSYACGFELTPIRSGFFTVTGTSLFSNTHLLELLDIRNKCFVDRRFLQIRTPHGFGPRPTVAGETPLWMKTGRMVG